MFDSSLGYLYVVTCMDLVFHQTLPIPPIAVLFKDLIWKEFVKDMRSWTQVQDTEYLKD